MGEAGAIIVLTIADIAFVLFGGSGCDNGNGPKPPKNEKPVVTQGIIEEVDEGSGIEDVVEFSDPENDPMTFTLDNAPTGSILTQVTSTSWKIAYPSPLTPGTYPIKITVRDNHGNATIYQADKKVYLDLPNSVAAMDAKLNVYKAPSAVIDYFNIILTGPKSVPMAVGGGNTVMGDGVANWVYNIPTRHSSAFQIYVVCQTASDDRAQDIADLEAQYGFEDVLVIGIGMSQADIDLKVEQQLLEAGATVVEYKSKNRQKSGRFKYGNNPLETALCSVPKKFGHKGREIFSKKFRQPQYQRRH